MSVRASIISFLDAAATAATVGQALYQAQILDHPAEPYQKDRGVLVNFDQFKLAPGGSGQIQQYDGQLVLLCYSRVLGVDKTARTAAIEDATTLAKGVATLFYNDPSIGGAVCDARCIDGESGWDAVDSQPYQLVGLVLLYNEIGQV